MILLRAYLCQEKEKSVTHPWASVWRVVSMASSSVLQSEIKFHTDYHGLCHGWICYERFYVRKEKSVTNPWTSVWRVVPMILSSVPQPEIKFHTDYHRVGHGWICYELFYVWKEKPVAHPWTSVWSVVSMASSSVLQPEIKFHTDYHGRFTDGFVTSFFMSEKRNPWLILGHPCEALSPCPAVVFFNLRLSFTRIITDGFVTSFFVWKEKSVTHLLTSVWRVVSMILSLIICRDDISMRGK